VEEEWAVAGSGSLGSPLFLVAEGFLWDVFIIVFPGIAISVPV
jgi:hypothetical protein